MTDAELVRHACDGHRSAEEQLVRRWSPRVLAVCHARIGRQEAAQDLAQETLIRGLAQIATLEHPERFGAWLRGIAIHVCLDWLRKRKRQQIPFSSLTASSDCVESVVTRAPTHLECIEQNEEKQHLLAEVDALPEELREPLLLFYYDEMTYQQIADLLEVSRATVNTRLANARARLARRLAHLTR